jgi:hypothetical protein
MTIHCRTFKLVQFASAVATLSWLAFSSRSRAATTEPVTPTAPQAPAEAGRGERQTEREARCLRDPRVLLGQVTLATCVGADLFFRETFGGNGRELRYVPTGTQSGLRIIVLFTDGASNGVPGKYDADPGNARSIRTWDFPRRLPDPDNQTWDNPHIDALYDTATGQALSPYNYPTLIVNPWDSYAPANMIPAVPSLPANVMSWHTHHRSSGIQTAFPLVTNALTVNGVAQSTARPLRHFGLYNAGRYPAEVFNINNAARNLVEIIANEARSDTSGDYKIRIYTIGMGYLVNLPLGTIGEPSSDILKRMANDPKSLDHNGSQLDGEYFPAPTAADVSAAFQGIQNQILRLSK